MYQRTHKSSTNLADDNEDGANNKIGSLKVSGRMTRKAARLGCIADALFTAELCEFLHLTDNTDDQGNDEEGTLASWTGRKVVFRTTMSASSKDEKRLNYPSISVLVIYEPGYTGGAGSGHGGVDDLLRFSKNDLLEEEDENISVNATTKEEINPRGRYLVILSDSSSSNTASIDDLPSVVSMLDSPPCEVKLLRGSTIGEKASVCEPLYHLAGRIVDAIKPSLFESKMNTEEEEDSDTEQNTVKSDGITQQKEHAIHIVGHSLAGGVAALVALMLDGVLPAPPATKRSKKTNESNAQLARGRTSAFCLGPPPCLSPNIQAPFITSIIHGDDIVCRTSQASLKHLCERTRHSIKGGVLGRSVGWMTDAVSLTVSGLKSQSKKTKDARLVVPGKVFLIRPRRLGGGSSSIHEVGDGAAGVRESLRAAVLWQLNDILLSSSMLTHHGLNSYIQSLDRVKLSGLADESSADE
jgi:hypothetical protein